MVSQHCTHSFPYMSLVHCRKIVYWDDALQRQLNIPHGKTVKIRKMRHRRIEGSCRASASHGSANRMRQCTAGAGRTLHSAKRDENRFSCWAAASPSARRREQRPQPRRGKVCGRARRRALCARYSRLVWQVSPRASRHARTHEYFMHHTAWTA